MSRRKRWKYQAGKRPYTVTVYEREPGGPIWARIWDPTLRSGKGDSKRRSLRTKNRDLAIAYADEQAAQLRRGQAELLAGRIILAALLELYATHRTPRKSPGQQREDRRRMALWKRFLGPGKDPLKITMGEWERFIELRTMGAINSRGQVVDDGEARRPVRTRAVEADLQWLKWVLNWGTKWRDREGRYLLRENPVRGYEIPTEKNPRRPVATEDRYRTIRAKADEVLMEVRWEGKREQQRSYLSELLDIANGTGRRISAICQLTYVDLKLNTGPYGTILWPAATDKTGRETEVPIGPDVRTAVDRALAERPGIGHAYIFPSPTDPGRPISRHIADAWLREAEKLAELKPQKGSAWHAYRRKWATERKHLPDVDVAAAGGWKETSSLRRAYQHADPKTMLRVVLDAGELREVQ